MKLITKATLIVILFSIFFVIIFRFVLYKRVKLSLEKSTNEINFILHRLNVKNINDILPDISDKQKLNIVLSQENIFKNHFHIIIDKQGNILKMEHKQIKIKGNINDYKKYNLANLFKKFKQQNKDNWVVETDKNYLYFFKLKNIGYLIIGTSKKELFGFILRNLKSVIISNIAIIFTIFLLIGFVLIAIINKEIKKLYSGIVQIKKGNLDFKFDENGSKEFREIYKTINSMTKNLQQNIANLISEKNLSEQYFEKSEAIMLVLDRDCRIKKINKKGAKILGFSKDELLGKNWIEEFIPKENREIITKVFFNLIDNKESMDDYKYFENKIITKNGERIISWLNSLIKNRDNIIEGILSSGFDITEIRKLEEERLKLMKLESIGVLAGGIAHDFNNLLTSISMNIELGTLYNKDEKIKEIFTRIAKVLERAKFLTNQLLTFSKGGEPIKQEHSIEDIIKETTDFILTGSNIKCKYSFEENLWHVNIDKGQISQVIQNIILNAKEAIPELGTIKISCKNKKFNKNEDKPFELKDDKYVIIKISDTGIGIPKKYLNKIFDPYFTTKSKGNGLGLSICYSIIKKHNGHIEVDSIQGEGTTFTIYIPAVEKLGKDFNNSKIKDDKYKQKKLKILILDDKEEVLEAFENLLEALGHEVVTVTNGEEAVDIYKKSLNDNPFDLLIFDLTIPGGKGGKETIKDIFRLNPEAKVVVSSGYSNDPVMANFKEYGFAACLLKPFKIEDLKKVLQVCFD